MNLLRSDKNKKNDILPLNPHYDCDILPYICIEYTIYKLSNTFTKFRFVNVYDIHDPSYMIISTKVY